MRLPSNPSTRLQCESLEGRDCPAAQVYQFGTFLLVAGDAAANTVVINDMGNGKLTVVADGKASLRSNVQTVVVATGAGDDTVSYNLLGSTSAASVISISTGYGSDNISLDGSLLNDSLTLGVNAGGSDDSISVTLAGVPLSQTVNLYLSGGAGSDDIDVTASGEIDGLLNIRANGGGGSDSLSGDIDVAAGSTGTVTAILAGSFGDDFLDLSVAGAGATAIGLTAEIRGGLGIDTGSSTSNVTQISIEA